MKTRNSNYELMRIVSMFLIVLYHALLHGNVINNSTGNLKIFFELLEFMTLVHVNSFVLLSGYFQVDSKFKQSKVWSITNSCIFYKALVIIIFSLFGIMTFSKTTIFQELFPLNLTEYWFIKYYLFLYCLSPFINKAISNFDKKTFKKLLVLIFVIFSIIPIITGNQGFENTGYTFLQFTYLYLIGAYFKKFPVVVKRIKLVLIFIVSIILNYLIYKLTFKVQGINNLIDWFSNNIKLFSIYYSNPFVMIQSIAYFLLFGTFKFKNKFINKLASLCFGVYLIHDNNIVRGYIYRWLKIDNGLINNISYVFYLIIIVILIYIVCSLIEYIRQVIFRFIYDRKISLKIRNKYYEYLDKLKIKYGL